MLCSETGYFGLLGSIYIYIYYPIVSYRRIYVYRVETMDMGISQCNNGVSGIVLISIVVINMVLIVKDKILW